MGNRNNNKRRPIHVQPQTLYHLEEMAAMYGYSTTGQVVDKLVREKQEDLSMQRNAEFFRSMINGRSGCGR